jgi:hypothetical protein
MVGAMSPLSQVYVSQAPPGYHRCSLDGYYHLRQQSKGHRTRVSIHNLCGMATSVSKKLGSYVANWNYQSSTPVSRSPKRHLSTPSICLQVGNVVYRCISACFTHLGEDNPRRTFGSPGASALFVPTWLARPVKMTTFLYLLNHADLMPLTMKYG